jgi:hypothetical protein
VGCSVCNARASRADGLVVTLTVVVVGGNGRRAGAVSSKVSKAESWRSGTVFLVGQLVVTVIWIL